MIKEYLYLVLFLFVLACNQVGTQKETDKKEAIPIENNVEVKETPDPYKDSSLIAMNEKIKEDINNPDLYLERAEIYQKLKMDKAAFNDIDRAKKIDSNKLEVIIAQADFVAKRGQIDISMQLLDRAYSLYPTSSSLHAKYAEVYLIARNNTESLKYADLAVKYDPYNAKAYYLKGYNFLEMGDTNKSISSYQTAVEQDPEYLEAYLELGYIFSLKNDPISLDYYRNALEVDPRNTKVLYSKAMFEQEHEMYNEALASYHKAIEIDSTFKEAYHNLGFVHMFYLQLYRESLKYYTKAIEIDPKYFKAYYNRGYSFELMGDIGNAEKDYRQALNIKPDYDLAANGISRLKE